MGNISKKNKKGKFADQYQEVYLTNEEIFFCDQVAWVRTHIPGFNTRNWNQKDETQTSEGINLLGACGEYAVSKALGVTWDHICHGKEYILSHMHDIPDIGRYHVRTAAGDSGTMPIRVTDEGHRDEEPFILVVSLPLEPGEDYSDFSKQEYAHYYHFRIAGYILLGDVGQRINGKLPRDGNKYWNNRNGRGWFWEVPQRDLRPFRDIKVEAPKLYGTIDPNFHLITHKSLFEQRKAQIYPNPLEGFGLASELLAK